MYALAFGYCQKGYALSARSFSQADMPLGFALRLYDAFSAAVQRKWTCWVARSLAGRGGLPLFDVLSMPILCHTKIVVDILYHSYIMSTHLIRRDQMEKVNGREYEVRKMETGENSKASLLERGWDGSSYCLTGKRGACYIAFRNAKTGELSIVTRI
jgi:hypothetical protein